MRKRALIGLASLMVAGCSTPGPSHLYSVGTRTGEVHDQTLGVADTTREVPNFVEAEETVTGFAYDPFTDHFFLRLAPGNRIRVVDRPDRKIKREFVAEGVPENGGGDLAVSPRDGHMYLVDPRGPQLFEITRLGKQAGTISLQGRSEPAAAVAYDAERKLLFILGADGRTIDRYTLDGVATHRFLLARAVRPSLAYDQGVLYAPLADAPATIGAFDERGTCTRTLPIASADQFIDAGPHSFLRVF